MTPEFQRKLFVNKKTAMFYTYNKPKSRLRTFWCQCDYWFHKHTGAPQGVNVPLKTL